MDLSVSMSAWLYLKSENKVTALLLEVIFWNLVSEKVFVIGVEKSPVKSEGELLYIRPGSAFNGPLSPLEEVFRLPFQTRVAGRLKWNNYVDQVLRILRSTKEIEKKYILPELKEKRLLKSTWLDQLRGKKRILIPEGGYGIIFDQKLLDARKNKDVFVFHLTGNEWNMF